MFRTTLLTLAATTLIGAPAFAMGNTKVGFDQAVDICTERALKFSRTLGGPAGEYPQPNMVQDRYRACVWAKSGQYPNQKVDTSRAFETGTVSR